MCNYRADLTGSLNCCVKHQFEVKTTLFIIIGCPDTDLSCYALLTVECLMTCHNAKAEAVLKLCHALVDKYATTLKDNHSIDKILDVVRLVR